MERVTLEAGAAALAAMVRGLGERLDALNSQSGWTNALYGATGGVTEGTEALGRMEKAPPDEAAADALFQSAGRRHEPSDPSPARERFGQEGGIWAFPGEMDAESMGRLVADTVNREIGRLARARRYTG